MMVPGESHAHNQNRYNRCGIEVMVCNSTQHLTHENYNV
jgi:hypothetical protein